MVQNKSRELKSAEKPPQLLCWGRLGSWKSVTWRVESVKIFSNSLDIRPHFLRSWENSSNTKPVFFSFFEELEKFLRKRWSWACHVVTPRFLPWDELGSFPTLINSSSADDLVVDENNARSNDLEWILVYSTKWCYLTPQCNPANLKHKILKKIEIPFQLGNC